MRGKTHEEKMVDRIGKLVRQAEGAPEGSPEREAFMDRAMTLSQAHSIDLAIARAKAYDKEKVEEPEERKYTVSDWSGRNQEKRDAHFVDLLLALVRAFDMRSVISHSNRYVWSMGYPSDHDLVERMYSMLSTQMVAEADAALRRGDHKEIRRVPKEIRIEIPEDERAWGDFVPPNFEQRYAYDEGEVGDQEWNWYTNRYYTLKEPPKTRTEYVRDDDGETVWEDKEVSSVDGRIWRANFYKGFVERVGQRMREARREAMENAGIEAVDDSTEKGIVLLNKREEINDRYERQMAVLANGPGYNGATVSRWSHGALVAGKEAAERATYGDEKVVD